MALIGSRTLGFNHEDRSGYKGRWTQNPHVFDNDYFKEVLLGDRTRFLRTPTEIMLYEDQHLKNIVERFAQDQNLFFKTYADAHVKMSEYGHPKLLSEFESNTVKEGGYVEPDSEDL